MDSSARGREIAAIIERLEKQFPDVAPPEVEAVTLEAHDAFNDHPIKTFVPVLVERHARERLKGRSAER
ncbi:three-helix bundle dimerization domain-containing protein [Micromonospora sp. DT81.3]|uniref:three-helix bundle dimerization domain-containing protein n=1 Tax=Micromonospora sp. DT81.3 TaxID=3416523 RepID=UPI003CF11632